MFLNDFFADADEDLVGCIRCRNAKPLHLELKMAFQPIVDVDKRSVFAYEALVRGAQGASAGEVIAVVAPERCTALTRPAACWPSTRPSAWA